MEYIAWLLIVVTLFALTYAVFKGGRKERGFRIESLKLDNGANYLIVFPEGTSDEEFEEFTTAWNTLFEGVKNSPRVVIIEGPITIQTLGKKI